MHEMVSDGSSWANFWIYVHEISLRICFDEGHIEKNILWSNKRKQQYILFYFPGRSGVSAPSKPGDQRDHLVRRGGTPLAQEQRKR